MNKEKLLEIIDKYLDGRATEDEKKAVDSWYESTDKSVLEMPVPEIKRLNEIRERSYQQIFREIEKPVHVIPFYRKGGFRAAAAIIFIAAIALYFASQFKTKTQARDENLVAIAESDVAAPSGNKARLLLSDGSEIEIDGATIGQLAVQGSVTVVKKSNGNIAYEGDGMEMAFNTLSVPRGSRPQRLELADGSQVWLNVASSITYPVSFAGNERKVEITGEVYFEVAKDPARQFIVRKSAHDAEIKVLGTHFNVNAYEDEELIRITLLEGSVQVNGAGKSHILQPGHQAQLKPDLLSVATSVDLDQVMAWKDGRFLFDGTDIKTIMRQIGKWYDVEVVYESESNEKMVANISRDVNVSELLEILEKTDLIHFDVEGRKITVRK